MEKKTTHFLYTERLGFGIYDNQINYPAGPFKISLSVYGGYLEISYTDKKWHFLEKELVYVAACAWETPIANFQKDFEYPSQSTTPKKYILRTRYTPESLKCYLSNIIEYYPKAREI